MIRLLMNKGNTFMIKRRHFLILGSILGISPYVYAQTDSSFDRAFKKIEPTLKAVQAHMFPQGSKLPSADAMHVTQFVYETMQHPSFDRDIKAFVIEGAEEFMQRTKGKFLSMTTAEKEKALRAYEETNYGSSWLERIMTLTMEGMFSAPVYGANIKEAGWKSIDSYGGFPRPTTKYMGR